MQIKIDDNLYDGDERIRSLVMVFLDNLRYHADVIKTEIRVPQLVVPPSRVPLCEVGTVAANTYYSEKIETQFSVLPFPMERQ